MFDRGVPPGDLNYAAACYPPNAARRSLNPRDGSLWRDGVSILVVTPADLPYARTFSPTPIKLSRGFRAKRVAWSG